MEAPRAEDAVRMQLKDAFVQETSAQTSRAYWHPGPLDVVFGDLHFPRGWRIIPTVRAV